MSLKDEFNIPKSTWEAMIRKGVISCAVVKQEEILERVKSKRSSGMAQSEAIKVTSIEMNISERWIYTVLDRYS